MSRQAILNTLTVLITVLVCFVALELGLRWLIKPSPHSYGRLLGVDLPPLRLAMNEPPSQTSLDEGYGLVVDGRKITYGDLWGYYRPDPVLGYAPQESIVSANGWWHNNELGARSSRPISPDVPPGHKRVLIFGESFAAGSRVPQEDAWPDVMDQSDNGLEVINFAVDGYGMGQSFLRFQTLQSRLNFDAVVLMFVPSDDLWRDINTVRAFADPQWHGPPMPRFIIQDDRLELIHYRESIASEQSLWKHAALYDDFYCVPWDSSWWIVGKVAVTAYCNLKAQRMLLHIKSPASAAMNLSRKIFAAMEAEVAASGALFLLVILPTDKDLAQIEAGRRAGAKWTRVASSACGAVARCLDLSTGLLKVAGRLDQGYDGTHYGPEANRIIAQLIEAHLIEELRDGPPWSSPRRSSSPL
jgi:hypothetical protein